MLLALAAHLAGAQAIMFFFLEYNFFFSHDEELFCLSPLAAHLAGAQAIGVTTGIFTSDDLCSAAPSCVVFDHLKDTDQVLAALGVVT